MLFTAFLLVLILRLPRLGTYNRPFLSKKVREDLAHTWILSWQAATWSGHTLKPRSCQTLPGSSVCTQFWWSTTEVHAQIFPNLLHTLTFQKSHTEWQTSSSLHWHTYKDLRLCYGLWQLSCCTLLICTSATSDAAHGTPAMAHSGELASAGAANAEEQEGSGWAGKQPFLGPQSF